MIIQLTILLSRMNKTIQLKSLKFLKAGLLLICMVAVFSVSKAVSINDDDNGFGIMVHTVKCYPNPATSFVNFEFPSVYISKNYSVGVYSFTGKKMFESAVNTPRITLNFSDDYFRGIYIYQLRDKTGRIIETGKFQVVK